MREYTMEKLKPTRQQIAKLNKELLAQRVNRANKRRGGVGMSEELAGLICLQNWAKLIKEGKIAAHGLREWTMEWDN